MEWHCKMKLSKYNEDINLFRGRELEFYNLYKPYETIEKEGNLLLYYGQELIMACLAGRSYIVGDLDSTHATIGVGDSSTPAVVSQTDLQAVTNKTYKGMDSPYPTIGPVGGVWTCTWQASFGNTEANYAWNEWVLKSNNGMIICLNRKVVSLGTKSGTTWTLQVTGSVS